MVFIAAAVFFGFATAFAASAGSIRPSWSRVEPLELGAGAEELAAGDVAVAVAIHLAEPGRAGGGRLARRGDIHAAARERRHADAGDLAPADRQLVVVGDLVGADLAVAVAVPRRDPRDRVRGSRGRRDGGRDSDPRWRRSPAPGRRPTGPSDFARPASADRRTRRPPSCRACRRRRGPSCRTARRTGRGPSLPTSRDTCCCPCRRPGTGRRSSSWRSRRRARRRRRGIPG